MAVVKDDFWSPSVWIADYISDFLHENGAMNKDLEVAQNGHRFTIPSVTSQIITPETSVKPESGEYNDYIIFGVERDDREDLPYKKYETMSLRIYTHRQASAAKIIRLIKEYMGDSDTVCQDLLMYQYQKNNNDNDYNFLSMGYRRLNGPEQLNLGTEGGLYASLIMLNYSYTYDMYRDGRMI